MVVSSLQVGVLHAETLSPSRFCESSSSFSTAIGDGREVR